MAFIKSLLNSIIEKIYRVLHSTQIVATPPALQSEPVEAIAQNMQKKSSTHAEKTPALQQNTNILLPAQNKKTSSVAQAIPTIIRKMRKGTSLTIHHKGPNPQNPAMQKMHRKHIEESARKNDPDAQCKLGLMYFNGTGIEQNDDMAKYWLENAAGQKLAMGQFNLAGMYYHGRGGAQNYETARALFEKAAHQGLAEAQFHLSDMYDQGRGIEHDSGKALYWLEEAARQGHREAQLKLLNNHCYYV